MSATVRIHHTAALNFTSSILQASGVSSTHASITAHALVGADLRGVDSHGINRIPSYLARIRAGALNPSASPTLTHITPVVAQVDAHNGFGFPAADLAITTACDIATTFGIGLVSVKNSNHFGMAAWIVQKALDKGMMSLVFTNSSPAMPAWGGREKLLGVSPIACGAPGGKEGRDFILDMCPSVVARGKIHKAARRGEKIPKGWALDKEGRDTDDPGDALDGGVMLPMGGAKGSALAIMMDVFAGVATGSKFAGGVVGPYDTEGGEAGVGHWMVVVKEDLFLDGEEFRGRMDVLYHRVVGSKKAEGVERIYFPGEMEQLTEEERRKDGIPFTQGEVDALNTEADRLRVPKLEVMG